MALTRTTDQAEEIVISMPHAQAFDAVLQAVRRVGKVKSEQRQFGRIVAKIGSGALNMNKADVTVIVERVDESQSKLIFRASAQEGVVGQGTAPKAISRILEAL